MPRARRVKGRIVAIGNSRGVRIPKSLDQAGLGDDVELHAEEGHSVIASGARPRAGWAEAAKAAHSRGDDDLIETPPAFDGEKWVWR